MRAVVVEGAGAVRVLHEVHVVEYICPERGGDWTLFLPCAYIDPELARKDMESHPDFRYMNMRVRTLKIATEI